jgi:hypothetical protein
MFGRVPNQTWGNIGMIVLLIGFNPHVHAASSSWAPKACRGAMRPTARKFTAHYHQVQPAART